MDKRAAIYVRTSTEDQKNGLEAQLTEAKARFEQMGITDYLVFSDDGISGTKESRPEFDKLREAINRGEIHTLLIYSISRISRILAPAAVFRDELRANSVRFIALKEGEIDLQSASGRFVFAIHAAVAELDRETILQNTEVGRKQAVKDGVKMGRKRAANYDEILALVDRMVPDQEIVKTLGVSRGAVQRAKASRKQKENPQAVVGAT
jgi:site-specific DNA recombinase